MSSYNLDNLSYAEFEKLCQALLKASFGLGIEAWGGQGDWGRDAYFPGELRFPRNELCPGPFVFQAKFVSGANAAGAKPDKLILDAVKTESKRIKGRLDSGMEAPKCYCLLTNVPLSTTSREKLKTSLQAVLPKDCTILIHGAGDLNCWILQHSHIANGFPRLVQSRDFISPVHNLPYLPNPYFIGRDNELQKIKDTFDDDIASPQVIVLNGIGGAGKTQLASEFAWKHEAEYVARFWINGSDSAVYAEGLASICDLLNLPEKGQSNLEVRIQGSLRWLRSNKRWLLIVDGVDKKEAIDQITNTLSKGLTGHLIITSRTEKWPITFSSLQVSSLQLQHAISFLKLRACCLPNDKGVGIVAELTAGLPLALDQAAAYIKARKISFEAYADRWKVERRKLANDRTAVPVSATRYQETVATTWRLTVQALQPQTRGLLRLMSFFGYGMIPRKVLEAATIVIPIAAEHVLFEDQGQEMDYELNVDNNSIEESLAELAEYSLIALLEDDFEIHPLIRMGEQDSVPATRHHKWVCLAVWMLAQTVTKHPQQYPSWKSWAKFRVHIAEALREAKKYNQRDIFVGILALSYGRFLNAQGECREAIDILEYAMIVIEGVDGNNEIGVARGYAELGAAYQHFGDIKKAEIAFRIALELVEKHPEKQDAIVSSLNSLGLLLLESSRIDEAGPLLARAFEIGKRLFDPEDPRMAPIYTNLGLLFSAHGNLDRAIDLHSKAFLISEKKLSDDNPEKGIHLSNMALQLIQTRDYLHALAAGNGALHILRKTLPSGHHLIGTCLNNIGAAFLYLKKFKVAKGYFLEAEAILSKAVDEKHEHLVVVRKHLKYLAKY